MTLVIIAAVAAFVAATVFLSVRYRAYRALESRQTLAVGEREAREHSRPLASTVHRVAPDERPSAEDKDSRRR